MTSWWRHIWKTAAWRPSKTSGSLCVQWRRNGFSGTYRYNVTGNKHDGYTLTAADNTLGSTVAIHLHDHGFNTTFTQGDRSLYWARYQARLLLRLGRCRSVLVGSYDESTPLFASLMQQLGIKTEPDVHSVAEVLTLAHQPSYTS